MIMSLSTSAKDLLTALIDEFPTFKDRKQKNACLARLTSILRDYHLPNSDSATQERFEGLEEKCRVLKNDELADALVVRYQKLEQWQGKWKFDIISFLLHLQDNPISKTCLDDLKGLVPDPLPPNLTWNDLLRDDPYDDESIWRSIDYAESSSGASDWSYQSSDAKLDHEEHSVTGNTSADDRKDISLAHFDDEALQAVIDARKEQSQTFEDGRLTERQLTRETLFMLQGLATAAYAESDGQLTARKSMSIGDISPEVMSKIMGNFCESGSIITRLRRNLAKTQQNAILQSFQASLICLLEEFDTHLSTIEQNIINVDGSCNTLLSIWVDIDAKLASLRLLGPLLEDAAAQAGYHILDLLSDLTVQQESLGQLALYRLAADVFFRCLNVYLRPVEDWMKYGTIEDGSDFFIQLQETDTMVARLWHDRFILRLNPDGTVYAPQFLQSNVRKVLMAGKGVNLLDKLTPHSNQSRIGNAPALDFESICGNNKDEFQPFDERLRLALEDWINARCRTTDKQVLDAVKHEAKLKETLSALQHLYFFCNGSISGRVTDTIFQSIDDNKRWSDRFYLTDLFQEALSGVSGLETQRITVQIGRNTTEGISKRSVQELAIMNIQYHLLWSTSIVIQPQHMQVFQKISIRLLQLKRAGYLLDRQAGVKLPLGTSAEQGSLVLILRHRLRWFVNTLLSYFTIGVLNVCINRLHDHLENVNDLDELVKTFDSTISSLVESFMLAEHHRTAHNTIKSILDLVVAFSDLCSTLFTETLSSSTDRQDGQDEHFESDIQRAAKSAHMNKGYDETLREQNTSFNQLLSLLITEIQNSTAVSEQTLLHMLLDDLKLGLSPG